jgi:glutamyl-tRNA reductase
LGNRALIIETCHRAEAFAVEQDSRWLAEAVSVPAGGEVLVGGDAVRHAITVAVGRDSVVIGEDQVLHQLRTSVDAARAAGTLDPTLERLFGIALRAGRRARSWRQGSQRSLADLALSTIERQVGPVRGRAVLVVGAGRMGRLAAGAAAKAGASVAVANRSAERADVLASQIGGRVEPFDPGPGLARFAGVIVALAGPWPIGATTIDSLTSSATVVVDLSVPPAVPAGAAALLGAQLITADALAIGGPDPWALQDGPRDRLDALIDGATAEFLAWQDGRTGRATAEMLVQAADLAREAELAALWRRLPDLEPDARDAIEGMTRHLADRLLREPLERLGRDTDGRQERAVRDLFAL